MPAPIPYGDETLVNTTTTNAQKVPQVTALANGNYVVVWQDASTAAPDNSPDSVRAQIFHADGTRLGSEFVLSEFPFAFQQDPVVTALPDGRFVAAWESFNHALQDQSGSHISARIFNPDGTPSTGEFQVNTHTDFWQTKPAIATLDTGGFVITWMHDFVGGNVNYDIFARVYDANGQPIKNEDRGVDISTGVIERAPVVTGLPGGKFVIAWEDTGSATQTDGSGSHIRAIIYTGDFQPLNGPTFTVNSTTVNNQSDPAIATLSNGNFIVTWTHQFSGTDDDVSGRVFNGNGAAQSANFGIDTSGSPVRETQSAITAMPNGQYFAVWRDSAAADGSGSHIRGAIMSGNGTAVSGQFIINTTSNGSQGEPAVNRLADGRVVVVWTDFGMNGGDTSGAAVRSQILDPRAGPVTLNGTGGNDEWVGTAFADTMNGGAGNDLLDGAGGNDTLIGGAGNDTYLVDNAGDVATEASDAGTDLVRSSVTFGVSGTHVENLTLIGSANLDGTGNALDNAITGNSGDNVLDGANGNDTLVGGTGNDTLIGGPGNDTLNGEAGSDTASYANAAAAVTVALIAGAQNTGGAGIDSLIDVENLAGSSFNDTLTGDGGANVLTGDGGADTMSGLGGNDNYGVDDTGDTVVEANGGGTDLVRSSVSFSLAQFVENLTLTGVAAINGTGNTLANILTGNAAANTLNGGAAADTMIGGLGNDTYVVDSAGDVVTEDAHAGSDTVQSSVGFTLGANLENLTLTGVAAINGTGNTLANTLLGNDSNNILNGKEGADTMKGGDGGDTYVVDDVGDVVSEIGGEGTDLVQSSATFSLGLNVENLTLTGVDNINGIGNGLANTLLGNTGNNILDGKADADAMKGGIGDDTYVVDNVADVVTEFVGQGTDLVQAGATYTIANNIENLSLTGVLNIKGTGNGLGNTLLGNDGNNVLSGLGGDDQISGDTGIDYLFGGAGNDDLTGGAGADRFQFDTALNAATNVDDILDFSVADDSIFLDRDTFTGLAANGILAASAFVNGTSAGDADDRIIYDSATGSIFYDADGNAAATQILFATVVAGTALTNADFFAYI